MRAPAPGWALTADVVVVGSGVAGLTVALRCAAAGLETVVVTKARLDDGSTRWAQGGIAAALGEGDTPAQHLDDTLVAGAGLCDEDAVRLLVTEGPDAVRRLIDTGARFDESASGGLALTREGGHHRRRIAHAGGDATGAEISRALVDAVRARGIPTVENALVLDLLTDDRGRAAGVTLHVMGEGQHDGVGAVHAPHVVLATGGMGQVFAATTNPAVSTGDGVALALRAGAEVSDLEFVQFHPTVLFLGPDAEGQQPLVSEAVRGEGAHLVDADGVRFMLGQHELAELAPRDIVAKAITRRMREHGTAHMYLDGRHFGAEMWERRFPTILAACRSHGLDPVTEPLPVAPAAHYASGGVRTDADGRTTVPGLYACGEVACTGVHGANRLASNSLLEGLVYAERIADAVAREGRPSRPAHEGRPSGPGEDRPSGPVHEGRPTLPVGEGHPSGPAHEGHPARPAHEGRPSGPGEDRPAGPAREDRPPVPRADGADPAGEPLLAPEDRFRLQRIMTEGAGVLRSADSLARAAHDLDGLRDAARDAAHEAPSGHGKTAEPGVDAWETTNLLTVARVLVAAARRREETRGCHWREDHADADDRWRHHLVARLGPDGTPVLTATPTERFGPTLPEPARAASPEPAAPAGDTVPGAAQAPAEVTAPATDPKPAAPAQGTAPGTAQAPATSAPVTAPGTARGATPQTAPVTAPEPSRGAAQAPAEVTAEGTAQAPAEVTAPDAARSGPGDRAARRDAYAGAAPAPADGSPGGAPRSPARPPARSPQPPSVRPTPPPQEH
ncbi:L-aspartate oxidase [Streptomyces sp. JNUCC 64]